MLVKLNWTKHQVELNRPSDHMRVGLVRLVLPHTQLVVTFAGSAQHSVLHFNELDFALVRVCRTLLEM